MAAQFVDKLPSELRSLVEFLWTDDRPTAIFDRSDTVGKELSAASILYENAALKSLQLGELGILRLAQDFQARKSNCKDVGDPLNALVDGRLWKSGRFAEKWDILVCNGGAQNNEVENWDDGSNGASPDSGIGLESNGVGENGDSFPSDCINWTQKAIPGLSSWIEYVRTFDWASTALGPMNMWPDTLQGYVLHIMSNPSPRCICWGSSMVLIFNEACIPLFCGHHEESLGKPAWIPWVEFWDKTGPLLNSSFQGKMNKLERMHISLERDGSTEETYWNLIMLPVPGPRADVLGIFIELTESTSLVLGERRRLSIMKLSQQIGAVNSLKDLWPSYLKALEGAVEDAPFALLYAAVDEVSDASSDSSKSANGTTKQFVLEGTTGVPMNDTTICKMFRFSEDDESAPEVIAPYWKAWKNREPVLVTRAEGTFPSCFPTAIPGRAFGDTITTATVTPITSFGGCDVLAMLVVGFNPRSPLGEDYKLYTHLMADMLIRAASLISLPQEQRRAQKVAGEMNTALAQQLRLVTLQAERTQAKFSRMAEAAPTGMFVFDRHGARIYVNDAFLAMLGESNTEHATRGISTLAWKEHIHEEDVQRFTDAWNHALEQKAPLTIEHRFKKPWKSHDKASGQEISGETWVLANAFPDVESDGTVSSVAGWLTDISHRKFTEQLLSRKLEDALENKRQTENFIDMTSHEMRNPLSAILQSADSIVSTLKSPEMLREDKSISLPGNVGDDIVDAAQTIILCAQHQKRIVDDILTLSKLDASLLEISPDKVQPPLLLDKALKMYDAEIARAGIIAEVKIEPTYEKLDVDWVVLDSSRLLQIIINLLTNAIKFTQYSEQRKITLYLGASYDRPSGKHHNVQFIPPKQARYANTPPPKWGEGQELYLQIAVSDTGRGLTEEEVKVLFHRFSQGSPKTYKQYGGSGLGLFISRELCELQGGQIGVSSADGETTFTFFVQAKRWIPDSPTRTTYRPTLPRFTSASASPVVFSRRGSAVVNDTGGGAEEPLVRVGSIKSIGEEDEASKDTRMSYGVNTIRVSSKPKETKQQLHVLIVEDNLINQKVMSQQLKKAGCIVHVANHGLECLKFLERTVFYSAEVPLSLILLDLEMPVMDGLTCIKLIRERQVKGEILEHVPVIAVTANARSEQISKAIDAGMDTVVTKPFRIPELVPQMYGLVAEVAQRTEIR